MTNDISVSETARILGVCAQSVRNYTEEGLLKATVNGRGHRRYNRAEVLAYAAQNACPVVKIDPEQLCKSLKHRLVVSPEFVKTLMDQGCDKNGVIACNDVIWKQVSPKGWADFVKDYRLNLAVALGEFLANWSNKDWTLKQEERVMEALFDLGNLIADAEFGEETLKYLED